MKNYHKYLINIFIILLLFSCRKPEESKSNNILNLALSGEISTLDPAVSFDTVSGTIIGQIYEPLFQYHYLKRPYILEPLLAKEMPKTINNGKSLKIKIKEGVYYHNDECFKGIKREVIVDDFITQIKRIAFKPTTSKGWWLFKGKIVGLDEFRIKAGSSFSSFEKLNVKGLEKISKYEFVIHLKERYPQLIYALAMNFSIPLPMEAVKHYKNNFHSKTIGTGPYKLQNWIKKHSIRLEKNNNYRSEVYPSDGDRISHDQKLLISAGEKIPFIKEVNFSIIKESNTRWLNFMAHKIEILPIPKDNYEQVFTSLGNLSDDLKEKNIKIDISPSSIFWWLSFNMKDKVVGGLGDKNKYLRKAIAHAIDIDRFIELFTNNLVLKANSIFPPSVPGYNPSSALPYKYDLNIAKKYMKMAGYDPNSKKQLQIKFDVRGNDTTRRQVAEFIKQELKKIGINIKIYLNTFPGFLKKADLGKLQFWQDGWALDYIDAENIVQLLVSKSHPPGPNSTFYSKKKVDDYFNQLKVMSNNVEKFNLMKKIEDEVNSDMVWIMLYYSRNHVLYHERLKNYRESDMIYNYIKYLKLK
jgi:oligopeptide transport system substrate-binding protein